MKGTFPIFLANVLLLARAVEAQVTFEGCVDFRGRAVASVLDRTLSDVARATDINGQPVVYYNPDVLAPMSPLARLFWYGHECGHHVLGHLAQPRPTIEREADCWSIRELRTRGLVTAANLGQIQATVARSPGDWLHLPGPFRVIDLAACLSAAPPRNGVVEPTEPATGRRRETTGELKITVRFAEWPVGAADFNLEVDGEDQGSLDNNDGDDSVELEPLEPGRHTFKLADITLWRGTRVLDSGGYCEGSFSIARSKTRYNLVLTAGPGWYRCRIN